MQIDVITLFPEFLRPLAEGSILGRAQEKGLVAIRLHDLRAYVAEGERVDDAPYGGGPGMVMRLAPIVECLEHLLGPELSVPKGHKVVVPSPAGTRFDQSVALELSALERLIIICGRYEGIDDRLFSIIPAEEISLGDFVLTGGDVAALAFVEATVRLIPGVIAHGSAEQESFADGSLDWPHYTRPPLFRGVPVPDVLLSGDHARIEAWRRERARERTAGRRPDLRKEQ